MKRARKVKKKKTGEVKKNVTLPYLFQPKSTNSVQVTHGESSKEYCLVQTSHITCIVYSRNPLKNKIKVIKKTGISTGKHSGKETRRRKDNRNIQHAERKGSRKTQTIATCIKKR